MYRVRRVALAVPVLRLVRGPHRPRGVVVTALPVCWCGDPGTFALDALHPAGVGTHETRWVWTHDGTDHLVVTRCRAHSGPFSSEVVHGDLVPVRVYPIDASPFGEGP